MSPLVLAALLTAAPAPSGPAPASPAPAQEAVYPVDGTPRKASAEGSASPTEAVYPVGGAAGPRAVKPRVVGPPAPAAQTVLPGVDGVPIKVERRLLVTKQHWFLSGGLGYLSRGDYYTSPGLSLAAAYYPREGDAIEARAHLLFSFLSPAAQDVFQQSGLVPDAQRPVSLLGAGWRHSFAYGKVLLGERVFHFDFQGAAELGLSITDRGAGPALMLAPGLLVRLDPRVHLQLEALVVASYEQRTRSFLALGFLPTLAIGVRL